MHKIEGLFEVSRRAQVENVERAFIATYNQLLSFTMGSFEARPRPPQNEKRLYRLLRIVDPHLGRQLIPRRGNALNALPDAMSFAVARPIEILDCGSYQIFTLDTSSPFAEWARAVASHDDERGIHELLESRNTGD